MQNLTMKKNTPDSIGSINPNNLIAFACFKFLAITVLFRASLLSGALGNIGKLHKMSKFLAQVSDHKCKFKKPDILGALEDSSISVRLYESVRFLLVAVVFLLLVIILVNLSNLTKVRNSKTRNRTTPTFTILRFHTRLSAVRTWKIAPILGEFFKPDFNRKLHTTYQCDLRLKHPLPGGQNYLMLIGCDREYFSLTWKMPRAKLLDIENNETA